MGSRMIASYRSTAAGKRPADLIAALKQRYGRPGAQQQQLGASMIDWAGIGADAAAAGMWRSGPGLSSMLGPLHEEAKVRRVAQVRGLLCCCRHAACPLAARVLLLLLLAAAAAVCLCWLGSEVKGHCLSRA
jgi:hypothetical protein